MLQLLRQLIRFIVLVFVVLILYLNVRLYDEVTCDPAPGGYVNVDVLRQLHFLRRMLREEKAGEEMQLLYPEGYIFTYALYALAWCDVVKALSPESVPWQDGMREIAFSLNALDAPAGRSVFNPDLPLAYGAFYRGWTAYVRGRYLQLRTPAGRDSLMALQFQGDCDAIAQAIRQSEHPYLESYESLAWPADNIVCLAALALHDDIATPRFQSTRAAWQERIKRTLDPEYGLIPHGYDLEGHRPLEGVRGSSQSLILGFMADIDPVFANEQYRRFRKHFLAYQLGLPGIREYPAGTAGFGDIDSGPVLAGIGGAASIVGIKTAIRYGDWEMAVALRSGVNALLLPQSGKEEKCYLFGQLPILDAFMAWSNTGICVAGNATNGNWRWKCQVISAFVVVAGLFLLIKLRKMER